MNKMRPLTKRRKTLKRRKQILELKIIVAELKNLLELFNSGFGGEEERIGEINIWSYLVRETEEQEMKKEWRNPTGFVEYH